MWVYGTLQIDTGKVKASSGLGVSVSKMSSNDETLSDDKKTIFDWCIEGNLDQVTRLLPSQQNINERNSEVSEATGQVLTTAHFSSFWGFNTVCLDLERNLLVQ